MKYDLYDRILGALIGAAAGDAMGAATEGRSHGKILRDFGGPVTDFLAPPNDTFGAGSAPGQVTDDFSSAYFLAQSITSRGGVIDRAAIEAALIDWSQHPAFFDRFAGPTTRAAIRRMTGDTKSQDKYAGFPARQATNGSAMRISPVGMLYPGCPEEAVRAAVTVTRITHDNVPAISGACAVAAAVSAALSPEADLYRVLQAAIFGAEEGERLSRDTSADVATPSVPERLRRAIAIGLGEGTRAEKSRRLSDEIGAGLHVAEAVPAAIGLVAANPGNPVSAIIEAANIGYDTDTVGTMVGAISGALSGAEAFPAGWMPRLEKANGLPLERMARAIEEIAHKHLPSCKSALSRREKVRGCILGAAAGDALGAPAETLSHGEILRRFGGPVTDFILPPETSPAAGRKAGQVTDAFSISYLCGKRLQRGEPPTRKTVEKALLEWGDSGWFAPFAGMTTRKVVNRLKEEENVTGWAKDGILGSKLYKGHYYALSSNGAAMRAYLSGLRHPGDTQSAVSEAAELTMASHDDVFSVSGAAAVAAAVSRALGEDCTLYDMVAAAFDGAAEGERLARLMPDIWDYPGPSVSRRLLWAVEIAVTCGDLAPDALRERIGCGPEIAETVPLAFGLLIAESGSIKALYDAAGIGDETSAAASLVGQLLGALTGEKCFPPHFLPTLDTANEFDLSAFAESFLADIEKRNNDD